MPTNKETCEERENRNKYKVEQALKSRCKHGMIFEYCGVCNAIHYKAHVRIPIVVKDKETGKDKRILWNREVDRVRYQRYR